MAHELFHVLTWNVFRPNDKKLTEDEERLANAFASELLMPEELIKDRVESRLNEKGQTNLDQLDNIAREFDVSLEALIYRISSLYYFEKEKTKQYKDAVEQYVKGAKPRTSSTPDELPERYCDLATRALKEGRLSLLQFAKYMRISYKKAQDYLEDAEDFTDEKISIPIA